MAHVKLAVVIPVGPDCRLAYVEDTLDSVCHYTTPSRRIVVCDDSGKGTGELLRRRYPAITVLTTPEHYGKDAGLYFSLSEGFRVAYEEFAFDVLLRLDTDALVIGDRPEDDALRFFRTYPDVGIIGSFRTDSNGDRRDFSWAREELARESSYQSLLREPRRWRRFFFLKRILRGARSHGYQPGEHCLGGAYFISRECIRRLHRDILLSRQEIRWSKLQEDHIFSLLMYSTGLKNGDFVTGDAPMAVRWRGLPCGPERLLADGKKVTHSTRFFGERTEEDIRAFFRRERQRATGGTEAAASP